MYTLTELLKHCIDRSSSRYEEAWKYFIECFHEFLLKKALHLANKFHLAKLEKQINEVVEDIVQEVFRILLRNDFKALRGFKATGDEIKFKAYLGTICRNATLAYIAKNFPGNQIDIPGENAIKYFSGLPDDEKWVLHDFIVKTLRDSMIQTGLRPELSLLVFNLRMLAGFTKLQIRAHPFLKDIDDRKIDNIVYRVKGKLVDSR